MPVAGIVCGMFVFEEEELTQRPLRRRVRRKENPRRQAGACGTGWAGHSRARVNGKLALPRAPFGRMAFPGKGLELFRAVGDPEKVIEFLRMAWVGIVGALVLVLDIGAGGLHALACFAGGMIAQAERSGKHFDEAVVS